MWGDGGMWGLRNRCVTCGIFAVPRANARAKVQTCDAMRNERAGRENDFPFGVTLANTGANIWYVFFQFVHRLLGID
jgi:hypothetical protein